MNSRFLLPVFAGLLALGQAGLIAQDGPFVVRKNGDNYRVEIDGKLFTEYIPKGLSLIHI